MQWGWGRRASCASRSLSRPVGVGAALLIAALAGACSSQSRLGALSASVPSGATVAFESIDGPPPEVFRKLVTTLNDEAAARQVAVVSRSGLATYRVRGYVSAMVERDRTSFSWVWDVYDADRRRTLRITGEEPATKTGRRDAWTAADEQVLRRMARNGMERVASFLNGTGGAAERAPEQGLPDLILARDDSPEAAGIVRVFGGQTQTEAPSEPEPEPAAETSPQSSRPAPKPAPQPRTAPATMRRAETVGRGGTQSAALDRRP